MPNVINHPRHVVLFIIICVLTVDVERDARLQPLAGRHRAIPHNAAELGTVIFAARRQRQRAGRLLVLGAAAADWRLQRNGATFAIPSADKT